MRIVFEPGDVVYLRSGSPPMTITALSEDGKIANVRWFEDETSYKDAIPVSALIDAETVERDRPKRGNVVEKVDHDWKLVNGCGEDAPGKSQTNNYYCPKCGALKVDYRHNGGQTSPNYPMYSSIDGIINNTVEPKCVGSE